MNIIIVGCLLIFTSFIFCNKQDESQNNKIVYDKGTSKNSLFKPDFYLI